MIRSIWNSIVANGSTAMYLYVRELVYCCSSLESNELRVRLEWYMSFRPHALHSITTLTDRSALPSILTPGMHEMVSSVPSSAVVWMQSPIRSSIGSPLTALGTVITVRFRRRLCRTHQVNSFLTFRFPLAKASYEGSHAPLCGALSANDAHATIHV